MEAEGRTTTSDTSPVRQPRRLWLWVVGGFLLVFVGMLLLVHVLAIHPSGQYLVQYQLWEYYVVRVPRLFVTTTLGPASGGTSTLFETAFFHLLFSVIGGGVTVAVGRYVRCGRASEAVAAVNRGACNRALNCLLLLNKISKNSAPKLVRRIAIVYLRLRFRLMRAKVGVRLCFFACASGLWAPSQA